MGTLPINTSATVMQVCPRCNADKGIWCKTPKGRQRDSPHGERISEYLKALGPEKARELHTLKQL